ncbi:MAG: hypothetical protein M1834_002032 [Cirrosporium novae-zelandiae]|nr:MAG: hypothetical protein M1834_002032 [Cirrosporium novae-zelandiae]
MVEQTAKRLKIEPPKIGTHNGHFHADEALAVYLLRLLPSYRESTLIRTRDPTLLETCQIVVDVGGEYSPTNNRYDHHMRTFTTTFPNHATKLSSAGLVYMHFGKDIIAQRTGLKEDNEDIKLLYEKIYSGFIEALDANDNGISVYDPAQTQGLQKRFNDSGINLGSLVGDINSNQSESTDKNVSREELQQEEDKRFLEASNLMGTVFLRKLDYYHQAWLPARAGVYKVFETRRDIDPQGRIMVLPRSLPWKDHLYTVEEASGTTDAEKVLYVLYPEGPQEGAKWRIQAVSVTKDSFQSRKPLPEKWRGVRDEDLDKVTGIEGCVFVHASGFIGGNKTFEGVKTMALQAVDI